MGVEEFAQWPVVDRMLWRIMKVVFEYPRLCLIGLLAPINQTKPSYALPSSSSLIKELRKHFTHPLSKEGNVTRKAEINVLAPMLFPLKMTSRCDPTLLYANEAHQSKAGAFAKSRQKGKYWYSTETRTDENGSISAIYVVSHNVVLGPSCGRLLASAVSSSASNESGDVSQRIG